MTNTKGLISPRIKSPDKKTPPDTPPHKMVAAVSVGLSSAADISSPTLHFSINVSHCGTYVVRSKRQGIKNKIGLRDLSPF